MITPDMAARAAALSDEALLNECELSFFVGSGPGGQHRNKTSTAVRLVHRPTGLMVVASDRRSQLMNRDAALERLRKKLEAIAFVPAARHATKPTRGAKRRRLNDKKHMAQKKSDRRGGWD